MLAGIFLAHELPSFFSQAAPIHLYGLNYDTRKGPDWAYNKCKERYEVLRDLTMVSRVTNRIRVLSLTDCGQGQLVLDVAKELGMQLWLGMWVGVNVSEFEGEKAELVYMLQQGMINETTVLGISVGSEAIYRKDATVDQNIGYMNEGKHQANQRVAADETVTLLYSYSFPVNSVQSINCCRMLD